MLKGWILVIILVGQPVQFGNIFQEKAHCDELKAGVAKMVGKRGKVDCIKVGSAPVEHQHDDGPPHKH